MRKGSYIVAFLLPLVIGCAEKSESQRISDAVKEELAKRGHPTQITRYAICASWEDPKTPVVECRFSRRPPRRGSEVLVIK